MPEPERKYMYTEISFGVKIFTNVLNVVIVFFGFQLLYTLKSGGWGFYAVHDNKNSS